MRIRLYEDYLIEDIQAVRNQYPMIDDETFNTILNCDPTYNPNRNSVGKYTKWLLNLYKKNDDSLIQSLYVQAYYRYNDYIPGMLQEFDDKKQALPNKDIGQFKSFEDLVNTLNNTEFPELSKRQQQRKDRTAARHSKDYEIAFENDDITVYVPLTKAASIKLGTKTNWCTASNGSNNMFNEYTEGGKYKLYIFELKNGKLYQYSSKTQEFRNANNKEVRYDAVGSVYDKDDDFYDFCKNLLGWYLPKKSNSFYALRQEDIKEIRLLSAKEYQKCKDYIPFIDDWWWLRSPGLDSYYAMRVDYDGDVDEVGIEVDSPGEVRPALLLNSKSELALDMESNLRNGEITSFNGKRCVKLAPFYYLVIMPLHDRRFDPESNNWETSEIRKWLNNPETISNALEILV